MPDFFTVHAVSLDDPGRYKPQMVFYSVRGYAWDKLDPALPKFDRRRPSRTPGEAAAVQSIAQAGVRSLRKSRAAEELAFKRWINLVL